MESEGARVQTFDAWPGRLVPAIGYAAIGFYCLGTERSLACFSCEVHAELVNPTWDPVVLHRVLNPFCEFLNQERERRGRMEISDAGIRHKLAEADSLPELVRYFRGEPRQRIIGLNSNQRLIVIWEAEVSPNNTGPESIVSTELEGVAGEGASSDTETGPNENTMRNESRGAIRRSRENDSMGSVRIYVNNASSDLSDSRGSSLIRRIKIELRRLQEIDTNGLSLINTFNQLSVGLNLRAKHRQYSELSRRHRSFSKWSILTPIPSFELAEAGFFFTGYEDETICYWCGGTLRDWKAEDNAWIRHARWFGHCKYIQILRGEKFIDATKLKIFPEELRSRDGRITEPGDLRMAHLVEPGLVADPESRLRCKICFEREIECVNMSCEHLVCCRFCIVHLDFCPVCREKLTCVMRVHIS